MTRTATRARRDTSGARAQAAGLFTSASSQPVTPNQVTRNEIDAGGEPVTPPRRVTNGPRGNAKPKVDPIAARAANDALEAPHGRCECCHAPLERKRTTYKSYWGYEYERDAPGPRPKFCGQRCKLYTWRRGGDPTGPLVKARADSSRRANDGQMPGQLSL